MTSGRTKRPIRVGDVVVTSGGPAMRVTGFGFLGDVVQPGPSAKLESLRRDDQNPAAPAWMAEILIGLLHVLPEDHYARRAPYYDWGDGRGGHGPCL